MDARLFAVDAEANLYANAEGAVIKLSSAGIPLQTNTICPLPGVAQRDPSGSFYFAGWFSGTQDFGGIVLRSGGPGPNYYYWPCGFLTKYDQGGTLLWAVKFGDVGPNVAISDLVLKPAGGCYVAWTLEGQKGTISLYDSNGNLQSERSGDTAPMTAIINLGVVTSSNYWAFWWGKDPQTFAFRASTAGNLECAMNDPFSSLVWQGYSPNPGGRQAWSWGKPVADDRGQLFQTGLRRGDYQQVLRKYATDASIASVVWDVNLGEEPKWPLARDAEGIYLGGMSNSLSKVDFQGTLIWQTNYEQVCVGMLTEPPGTLLVSFADGSFGRLAGVPRPPKTLRITEPGEGLGPEGFRMTVMSAPGVVFQIMGSDDCSRWQSVGFVTNTTGEAAFTDPEALTRPVRFYKPVQLH